MRLKVSLSLVVLFFFTFCKSQNVKNCQLLDAFLKSTEANKHFQFSENNIKPIIIVDLKKAFENCQIPDIYGRKIQIVADSSYLPKTEPNIIIVYSLKKVSKMYILELHQKNTGSYGRVQIKMVKKSYRVIKFSVGWI